MKSFNHLTIKPFSHLINAFLTITRGNAEIHQTSEIVTPPIREITNIFLTTKKSAFADFGEPTKVGSDLAYHLVRSVQQQKEFVNHLNNDVEVAGFAPAGSWMISQIPYSSTPTSIKAYQKEILKAIKKAGGYLKAGLSPANRHSTPANKRR